MTDAAAPTGREFRIGPIFTRSWSIYAANFVIFTLVAIVVALPHQFGGDAETVAGGVRSFVAAILGVILEFVGQAVILYGAFQAMRGRPVMIGDAVRRGFARFWSIVGVSILVSLGIFVGLILFIIPGVILALRWAVALPACVVENLGPLASMRRSADLTKGHRWQILGITVLIIVVFIIAFIIIGVLVGLGVVAAPEGLGRLVLAGIVTVIVTGIITAYFNVVAAMIYHDLRVAKEGVGTEEIAAVFD
jgi:uncharacterized membrane protein